MSAAVSGRYIPKPNEVTTRNKICQGAAVLIGLAGLALVGVAFKGYSRSLISRAVVMFLSGILAGSAFRLYRLIGTLCTAEEYKGALQRNVLLGDKTGIGWILFLGANPNNSDKNGITPLHVAKDPNIVQQLISHGADVNAGSSKGTPLHCAFRLFEEKDKIEIVKILVKNGADLNAEHDNGRTFLEKAKELQFSALADKQRYYDWEEIFALARSNEG